jgi:hypothetical protein
MTNRARCGRSAAQWFCLIVGGTLVVVGLLGFLAEATFDTSAGSDPGALDGENFILFEVNGWHNVVHIASGLFLLVLMGRHQTARTAALAFGAIYAVVTVMGLIDGHDVLGLIPVNPRRQPAAHPAHRRGARGRPDLGPRPARGPEPLGRPSLRAHEQDRIPNPSKEVDHAGDTGEAIGAVAVGFVGGMLIPST